MFATIVFLVIAASALVAVIVIFTPFGVIANFTLTGGKRNGRIVLYWLHPRLNRLTFYIDRQCITLCFLNWSHELEHRSTMERLSEDELSPSFEGKKPSIPLQPAKISPKKPVQLNPSSSPKYSKLDKSPKKKSGSWLHRWNFMLRKAKKILSILLDRRIVLKTLRWLHRDFKLLLHLAKLHHVHLKAKAGGADPAETGNIYALFVTLRSTLLSRTTHIDIRFEPYFSGAMLEVEGSIGVTSSVARLLLAGLVSIATFPWLVVFDAWRKLRKVRNEIMSAAEVTV
jgi:hypothetical protein